MREEKNIAAEAIDAPQVLRGKKRDSTYDWVRLIAMIFVVIGHSAYLNIQTTYGEIAYELPQALSSAYYSAPISLVRELSSWVYGFHMPLFFMLSGAVFALKPMADMDSLIKKKFHRLLIPYFVYGWLFMLPVKYAGGFYTAKSFRQALCGFLSGEDSGHLWFLTALFWVMVIYAGIAKILQRGRVKSEYVLLLICGGIQFFYDNLPFDFLGIKTGLSYIFWFALGCIFQKEKFLKGWSKRKKKIVFILLILLEVINKKFFILDKNFTILAGALFTYILAEFACHV